MVEGIIFIIYILFMFLDTKGVDHLPSTLESRGPTPTNNYSKSRHLQTTNFKPYQPTKPLELGKSKTNLFPLQCLKTVSKPLQSTASTSKQNNLAQLVQLLLHSITSQLQSSSLKSTKTSQIKVNSLMLHRIEKLKSLMPQLKELYGEKAQKWGSKGQIESGQLKAGQAAELKKYMERQSHLKKELQRLFKMTSERPYHSLGIFQLLNHLGSIVAGYAKDRNEQLRLQNENKKIRLYYISQIEHCKEELKFIHEVIQEKQLLIEGLERQFYQLKKNREDIVWHYDEQETFALDQMQERLRKGNMKRSGSLNLIDSSFNIEKQSSEILQIIQPIRKVDSPRKSTSQTVLVNPESHQKSKSDLHVQRNLAKEDQVIVYTEIGSPNPKLSEAEALLFEKIQESQKELVVKSERLAALDEEIVLLQQNVSFLNGKISVQEDDFSQKERTLQDLSSKIKVKEQEVLALEQKIRALGEEQELQEYNIDKTQEQLYFLEEQCQLVTTELENRKSQLINLNDSSFKV